MAVIIKQTVAAKNVPSSINQSHLNGPSSIDLSRIANPVKAERQRIPARIAKT